MLFRKFSGAFLAVAVVLGGAFGLHRAAASQGERREGGERWEHCALVVSGAVFSEGSRRTGLASVCHFSGAVGRCEEVRVPFTGRDSLTMDAIKLQTASTVISRLGAEGWQLVDEGTAETFGMTGARALYFKRPAD
jgi:methenyltetrahydromethanopterin cyclohydrolase